MRLRVWPCGALLLLTFAHSAFAQEQATERKNYYDFGAIDEERTEKLQQRRQEARQKLDEWVEREIRQRRERLEQPLPPETVYIDGKPLEVREPMTMAEVIGKPEVADPWGTSARDFDMFIHDIWEIGRDDVRMVMKPREVLLPLGKRVVGKADPQVLYRARTKFLVPFSITNSTAYPRRMGLRVWIATGDNRFTPEVGGWTHMKMLEESALKYMTGGRMAEWVDSMQLVGYEHQEEDGTSSPRNVFKPGETRFGVAVFPRFDQEMDEMKIIFEGVSNAFKYNNGLKRVLTFKYTRKGDEFYPDRESLKFQGKEWEWIWMWWSDFKVPTDPEVRRITLTTATGRELDFWVMDYVLTNRTGEPRTIEIDRVCRAVDVDLTVAGQRFDNVEVNVVDDGLSTIYKADVMRETGMMFKPDRLFKGELQPVNPQLPGSGETRGTLIFSEKDIDWERLFARIEHRLNLTTGDPSHDEKIFGVDYYERLMRSEDITEALDTEEDIKRRRLVLSDQAKENIRRQVRAALREKLEQATDRKRVQLNVRARSGLASGEYHIIRYYNRPGEIESDWIHEWQDVDEFDAAVLK